MAATISTITDALSGGVESIIAVFSAEPGWSVAAAISLVFVATYARTIESDRRFDRFEWEPGPGSLGRLVWTVKSTGFVIWRTIKDTWDYIVLMKRNIFFLAGITGGALLWIFPAIFNFDPIALTGVVATGISALQAFGFTDLSIEMVGLAMVAVAFVGIVASVVSTGGDS